MFGATIGLSFISKGFPVPEGQCVEINFLAEWHRGPHLIGTTIGALSPTLAQPVINVLLLENGYSRRIDSISLDL